MLRINLLFIGLLLLMGCSQYRNNLTGHGHEYKHAKVSSSLEYPKSLKVLPASNRYTVPNINPSINLKQEAQEEWPKFLPPDYK